MKRVYFAGSIRGGREDLALYAALIARLRERSEVLTEFIGESTLEDIEAATMTDFDIYERDMALLHQADAVVAECSTPSLGWGTSWAALMRWDCRFISCTGREKAAGFPPWYRATEALHCCRTGAGRKRWRR